VSSCAAMSLDPGLSPMQRRNEVEVKDFLWGYEVL
jgi:hypothetical protein